MKSYWTDKIDRYIDNNTSETVKTKGNTIFRTGGIHDLNYSIENDFGQIKIFTGEYHHIDARNIFQNLEEEINTACDCEDKLNRLCKHQVAALLAIKSKFKYNNSPIILENQNQKAFVGSHKHDTINDHTLNNLRSIPEKYDLTVAEVATDQVLFDIKESLNYWDTKTNQVTIEKKEGEWVPSCDCSNNQLGFCNHQVKTLQEISKNMKGMAFFEKLEDQEYLISKAMEDYHVSDRDEFFKNFELGVDEKYNPTYLPSLRGFYKNESLESLQQALKQKSYSNEQTFGFQEKDNDEYGYGIFFNFDEGLRENPNMSLQLISGKLNKSKDGLSSNIDTLSEELYVPVEVRSFVNEFNHWLNFHAIKDERYENISKRIFNLINENIELLTSNLIYKNKESSEVRKTNLEQIEFLDQPATLFFIIDRAKHRLRLRSMLKIGSQTIPLEHYSGIQNKYVVSAKDQFALIPNHITKEYIRQFSNFSVIFFDENNSEYLKNLLENITPYFKVDIAEEGINQKLMLQNGRLAIQLRESGNYLIMTPVVQYGELEQDLVLHNSHAMIDVEVDKGQVSLNEYFRNSEEEQKFKLLLTEYDEFFLQPDTDGNYYKFYQQLLDGRWIFNFFDFCAANEIEILGDQELTKFRYNLNSPDINLHITSGIDWFDAQLEVSFGDQKISVEEVKHAILKGDSFVRLADGSLGVLPEEWVERLETLFRVGITEGKSVKISKLKFNIIDALFDQIDNEELRLELEMKKQHLKAFENVKQHEVPSSIKATLRPYQVEGYNWIKFLDEFDFGGCLADDMGLGKTLQVITFLADLKERGDYTSLVVVPRSLLQNWKAEIDKFCPTLTYAIYHGTGRHDLAKDVQKYDVIISTYGTVSNDIDTIMHWDLEYAILDESQAIKNPQSKRYKAMRLIKARNRLVLTGTPIENNTFDLFAQFNFLNPGIFGSQNAFKEYYSSAIDGQGNVKVAKELRKIIHPFLLRRVKQQVAQELPEKTEQIIYVDMYPEQRKVYEQYLEKYRNYVMDKINSIGLNKSALYVLEGLLKLRQICNSPALLSSGEHPDVPSAKIDVLIERLLQISQTNKVLVFSQFTSMLDLIRQALDKENLKYLYLDGKTRNRLDLVNRFNESDDEKIFLISLKAGGTGLNLTSAEYVFLVDPWWNPAVEAQAIDRAHRIGQVNHVFAYRMICLDSIEEKIVKLQEKKKMVSNELIQAKEGFIKSLGQDDIQHLFM